MKKFVLMLSLSGILCGSGWAGNWQAANGTENESKIASCDPTNVAITGIDEDNGGNSPPLAFTKTYNWVTNNPDPTADPPQNFQPLREVVIRGGMTAKASGGTPGALEVEAYGDVSWTWDGSGGVWGPGDQGPWGFTADWDYVPAYAADNDEVANPAINPFLGEERGRTLFPGVDTTTVSVDTNGTVSNGGWVRSQIANGSASIKSSTGIMGAAGSIQIRLDRVGR